MLLPQCSKLLVMRMLSISMFSSNLTLTLRASFINTYSILIFPQCVCLPDTQDRKEIKREVAFREMHKGMHTYPIVPPEEMHAYSTATHEGVHAYTPATSRECMPKSNMLSIIFLEYPEKCKFRKYYDFKVGSFSNKASMQLICNIPAYQIYFS